METLLREIRYSFRTLGKNHRLSSAIILSLALGIGANTAIFSVFNAVTLRTLPVNHPEKLVLLTWISEDWPEYGSYSGWTGCPQKPDSPSGCSFSYSIFENIRAHDTSPVDVFAFADLGRVAVNVDGEVESADAVPVSGDYFATLGVPVVLGRLFSVSDDEAAAAAAPSAVISYSFWMRRFQGDKAVLGKTIGINGVPFAIIGVAPASFYGLQPGRVNDIWIPLALLPKVSSSIINRALYQTDNWWVMMMGRLKPGASKAQAKAWLDAILLQHLSANKGAAPQQTTVPRIELVEGGRGLSDLRRQFTRPLLILLVVVGAVLIIACSNVANLLLARAAAQQKEIAVRLAIGAKRRRLSFQLLTESSLLGILGGAAGLVLAYWGSNLLIDLMSATTSGPVSLDVHPDLRVLGFTISVSLLTGILLGLIPAIRSTRLDIASVLSATGRSQTYRRRLGFLRLTPGNTLVMTQVAISLFLLISAGLFIRSLQKITDIKPGFEPENLLLFGVDLRDSGLESKLTSSIYREVLESIHAVPGVQSASFSDAALISGAFQTRSVFAEGYQPTTGEIMNIDVFQVGPLFFGTMRIPILLGRDIMWSDSDGAKVAVINEAFASRYFHAQNPLGQHLRWSRKDRSGLEIVGLVGNSVNVSLRQEVRPTVYIPYPLKGNIGEVHFEVRTAQNPRELLPAVHRVLQHLESQIPLFDVKTQMEQIDESLSQERVLAQLTSAFAIVALALACVGVYGMVSYAVVRRTNEIGIRLALGARRIGILGMVLREFFVLVGISMAIGFSMALAASRVIGNLLYPAGSVDVAAVALASCLLLAVVLAAVWLPASRATRVDPVIALRFE
ncbi:MAG TPA: ABC transporter permease [Candidatus Angelobacter sp.]